MRELTEFEKWALAFVQATPEERKAAEDALQPLSDDEKAKLWWLPKPQAFTEEP